MHRIQNICLIALLWFCSFNLFAEESQTIQENSTNSTATANTLAEMERLQRAIDKELSNIERAKGELKSLTEFRINNKALALREHINSLMLQPEENREFLTPIVTRQQEFIAQVGTYLRQDIAQLKNQLGKNQDSEIMLSIAQRQFELVRYYQAESETIQWAKQLDMDVKEKEKRFNRNIVIFADEQMSQVNFTQLMLKQANANVKAAGTDVTAEQSAEVVKLKSRLAQHSQNLEVIANILDSIGKETAKIREALFSISGAITQDVLNLDVASSLIGHWFGAAKYQAFDNGPKLIFKLFVFVLILFLGHLAGNITKKLVKKTVGNSKLKFSKLLQEFFTSLSSKAIFTVALLIALSQLGFELGPLLAGFGIAGVIIGFALQDTLSNFASGMMILIYRPYDVGDLITAAGVTGRVSHMSLVSTTVKTLDNQRLIIPNNKIWGDTINNITVEHQRRVDMVFGIGYSDDIEHAERVLNDILKSHDLVLAEPEPLVKLHTLNNSSVDFVVRPWVKPGDYWDVYWDVTREVKMRFDAEGISIPFPQRDVHIYQQPEPDQ